MSLPPKTVYALLQQVLKDPEIGPGAISEAKKECPGLLALISQTKKELQKASQVLRCFTIMIHVEDCTQDNMF